MGWRIEGRIEQCPRCNTSNSTRSHCICDKHCKKAHLKDNLARNAITYSSSDSSSPLGKLTSSSSSAFLLREDMVMFEVEKGINWVKKHYLKVIKGWMGWRNRGLLQKENKEERDGKG